VPPGSLADKKEEKKIERLWAVCVFLVLRLLVAGLFYEIHGDSSNSWVERRQGVPPIKEYGEGG